MKRIVSFLLAGLLLLSMTACSGEPLISFKDKDKESQAPVSESEAVTPSDSGSSGDVIEPDDEDYAQGVIGDTLRTSFFDMRVESAYSCYEFDGVQAEEGYKLVVVDFTLFNYTKLTQPMFFNDFEIWWDTDDEEDYWAYPMHEEVELEDGSTDYRNVSEQQLPVEYDLGIRETREGILLYQVPEETKTYSIVFLEYFEDESVGAMFDIRFSAPLAEE